EISPGDCFGCACVAKADSAVADPDRTIILDAEPLAPAAVHAVEFEEVRRGSGPPIQLIHMDHVETIIGVGIVCATINTAHRCTQSQTSDAAHTVDANAHFSGSLS